MISRNEVGGETRGISYVIFLQLLNFLGVLLEISMTYFRRTKRKVELTDQIGLLLVFVMLS
jgi:hypothetical protein